jgi:hypothetical protein
MARRLTESARILAFREQFLLRARNWKKAFTLGLFAGEFSASPDCLLMLSRGPFRWLFVESPELHLPKHALSLHFLFEDTKRLVDVVVANQNLQGMIPSLRRWTSRRSHVPAPFGSQAPQKKARRAPDLSALATTNSLLLLLRRLRSGLIALILLGSGGGSARRGGLGGFIGTRLRRGLHIGHKQLL